MIKKFFVLALSLVLAMPFVMVADDHEEVIELVVVGSGNLGSGDDPLDSPIHSDPDPSDPSQFYATITGRTLAVSVSNGNNTQVIVRNGAGNVVVNTQFVGFTSTQLAASGAHSIEIHNGGLTLVGNFQAH